MSEARPLGFERGLSAGAIPELPNRNHRASHCTSAEISAAWPFSSVYICRGRGESWVLPGSCA